jgi:hypothetical protein
LPVLHCNAYEPVALQRLDNLRLALSLAKVGFIQPDDKTWDDMSKLRTHRLEFVAFPIADRGNPTEETGLGTACNIELFGGIFSGRVVIADRIIHSDSRPIRIDF